MPKHITSWVVVAITAIVAGCVYAQSIHNWDGAAIAGLVAIIGTSIKASLTQTPQDAKTEAVAGEAISLAAEYVPDVSKWQQNLAGPLPTFPVPPSDAPPPSAVPTA